MKIKVLGTDFRNCEMLYKTTLAAAEHLGIEGSTMDYVKELSEITKYIIFIPGVVVDYVGFTRVSL